MLFKLALSKLLMLATIINLYYLLHLNAIDSIWTKLNGIFPQRNIHNKLNTGKNDK